MMMERNPDLKDIQVLQRGWLSSNNILLADEAGVALIDSGYASHAEQTEALVRRALGGRRLTRLINTHLHSDHCGGNARLQRAYSCEVWIPPGQWADVRRWDTDALTYAPTGQHCERFVPDRVLLPGSSIELGGRSWAVIGAPGHDPHSIILFDPRDGVLISADALWENGFGIVFPELEGISAFADVAAVLDLIESLDARITIPGHGGPFADVEQALTRARHRLDGFVRDPAKHARHAAKVLIKFRLLEKRVEPNEQTLAWASGLGYLRMIHQRYFATRTCRAWLAEIIDGMCATGILKRAGINILNM
jgi:glyoxylase-like metal-dependent hydrolase (beta-lactamase superfamily II)